MKSYLWTRLSTKEPLAILILSTAFWDRLSHRTSWDCSSRNKTGDSLGDSTDVVDIFWVWFWFVLWFSSTNFLSGRHSHYIYYWWSLWNASCLPVWSLCWEGLPASCFWTSGWQHVTHAQPRDSPIEDSEWWGSETKTIRNKSLIAMAWTIQLRYYLVVRVKGPCNRSLLGFGFFCPWFCCFVHLGVPAVLAILWATWLIYLNKTKQTNKNMFSFKLARIGFHSLKQEHWLVTHLESGQVSVWF